MSQKRPLDDSDTIPPSIFGYAPTEEILKVVSDFLFKHLTLPNTEIEVKLGVIIDKNTSTRLLLPIQNECILSPELKKKYRFESNMTIEQHKHYNQMLNELVKRSGLEYKHQKQIDGFYDDGNNGKLRVSKDEEGNQVEVIRKKRLADLDIFSPQTKLDFRISVNVEEPLTSVVRGKCAYERKKDRLSYTQGMFTIDLTQVKSFTDDRRGGKKEELKHELEIEVAVDVLMEEKAKSAVGRKNKFANIIHSLLSNARLLARKAL